MCPRSRRRIRFGVAHLCNPNRIDCRPKPPVSEVTTTVTGRFGVASDQWLFYGKAGWAGAQVDFSGRNTALQDSFSFDEWRNGWTLGVGLEYKIGRNMSFGVEYSFIELNSERDNGVTRLGQPVTLRDHDLQSAAPGEVVVALGLTGVVPS
jgi:opacity protein-like surface antigen